MLLMLHLLLLKLTKNAMLADGGQTTNQITIKATEKPTVDIPITIVIRNDL